MPCRAPDYLLPSEIEEASRDEKQRRLKAKQRRLKEEQKKFSFLEAALCATIRAFAAAENEADEIEVVDETLNCIDYEEAGITKKQLMDWFIKHKKKDDKRKSKNEKKFALKKSAEEKVRKLLTAEERKILGLK